MFQLHRHVDNTELLQLKIPATWPLKRQAAFLYLSDYDNMHYLEPHANFKAIWAPYLRYLERPNTGQNQIYPGSAIGGLYFTSDIHGPCLRSSPKVTLDMEIDGAGVKILLVELSTLLI